jgi:SAM-dependent methyltransferase
MHSVAASTLAHLEGLGWIPPAADDSGVRALGPVDEPSVSFPPAAYGDAGGDAAEAGFYLGHRVDIVADLLTSLGATALWEVGAGNGNLAVPLARRGFDVCAVEPLRSGAVATARRGVTSICSTLEDLRLPDSSLPVVGMFDVLEHLQDPRELLGEVFRVLETRGILIVLVPAGSWLWTDLDVVLGHYRRYSKETLRREVASAGFRPLATEYVFASLVPAAAVLRALPYWAGRRRTSEEVLGEVRDELNVPAVVDKVARLVLRTERRLSRALALPFGLSVLGTFSKAARG